MKVPYLLIHVTHWSCDHVILKKRFISTCCSTMATKFSKVWLKLSWPQTSSQVSHPSFDHFIFKRRWSPVSQRQWSFNLVGLWVRVKGPHQLFQVIRRSSHHVFFEKRHVSNNARPQNPTRDIKHRKNRKPKAFFVIQKILTFDSHRYTQL